MKGISPIIAVILLVAFVVAAGGIVGLWSTTLTSTTSGRVETSATNATTCAGVYILVDRVTSTNVVYTNPSSDAITSIKIVVETGETITGSTSLASGSSANTTWTRGTNTSVTLYGKCQGSIIVQGKCESGQACWK